MSQTQDFAVVILAAGQGTRMRSDTHKVLHPIAGRPLLSYLRYNVTLEESYLNRLGLPELGERHKLETLRDLGAGENLPNWSEIGKRAALDQIEEEHFPTAFDIQWKASVAAGS